MHTLKHLETFISDDECTVRFGDILMSATGVETFPPLGFTLLLNMIILHSSLYAMNTCIHFDNYQTLLTLYRVNDEYRPHFIII